MKTDSKRPNLEQNNEQNNVASDSEPSFTPTDSQQPDWLQELEERSRTAQKDFIDNISTRLKRPIMTEPPQHPFRGAPPFWASFDWNEEERIQRFTQHFQEVGGHVTRVADWQEAGQWIAEHARHLGAQYIVRQQLPELEQLQLEMQLPEAHISVWNSDPAQPWKARAAEADIGVVLADGAAAYTGTVMVTSAAQQGRSVSLLPTVCVVLLPRERLFTRLGELLIPLDTRGRENLPAGVHFISGPSRSSDIENDLTIGVHGPGIIYTLLIG
ncbi:LutC/YkgG family protein [Paenibacillus sp. WLX2291]|uniref:LutC/YkgG family protein n=1 Tax=Paenibacillus sp. WLX2291 TaxID=3296934 RepID=UPI0039844BD0